MIAIPNMDKPKGCRYCRFVGDDDGTCRADADLRYVGDYANAFQSKPDDCPLIEIDLEKDIPTIWYNRQTRRYEPKGTKQEVYERLYKLKNGERRNE